MSSVRVESLLRWFDRHLPQFSPGLLEAKEEDPIRFERLGNRFLSWAEGVLGEQTLEIVARSYANFTMSVNLHQARYELAGHYQASSTAEFQSDLYDRQERMEEYLWGVYLTFFLWPHHLRLARFFEERYLPRITPGSRILELAFGHGGWGQWALTETENTTLTGVDISESSVEIARALAHSSKLAPRTEYRQGDALSLAEKPSFDQAICGFVIEHLEQPHLLYEALASHLRPGGILFLTGALTAAQEDHIFEFVRESELVTMAEVAGFRALETVSEGPSRTLPKAKYLPRSMALILQRRRGPHW